MGSRRGLWVWNTAQLLTDPAQVDRLISTATQIRLTDTYVYTAPQWYEAKAAEIADLNSRLCASGIRVWALDGDRAYIDNRAAKAAFLESLENLGRFNQRVQPSARFHGFQADIEPQDTAEHTGLINGIADSRLSPQQRGTRDKLLLDWLDVLTRASELVRGCGMEMGAALPWWLHDYEGEALTVPTPGPQRSRKGIMELIMPLVDEYVVMSYNTNPSNAARRVEQQARYASEQIRRGSRMPRVLGGVEIEKGVGEGVSYGDTAGKESNVVVLNDIGTIERRLAGLGAFAGVAIHHWAAWEVLPL